MNDRKTIRNAAKELHMWLVGKGATHTRLGAGKKRRIKKRKKEDDNPNQMYVVASFKSMDD